MGLIEDFTPEPVQIQQCVCVNANHEGGRCTNTTYMHHLCGPCRDDQAVLPTKVAPDLNALAAEIVVWREAEHALSEAYLRVRSIIGAFDRRESS